MVVGSAHGGEENAGFDDSRTLCAICNRPKLIYPTCLEILFIEDDTLGNHSHEVCEELPIMRLSEDQSKLSKALLAALIEISCDCHQHCRSHQAYNCI